MATPQTHDEKLEISAFFVRGAGTENRAKRPLISHKLHLIIYTDKLINSLARFFEGCVDRELQALVYLNNSNHSLHLEGMAIHLADGKPLGTDHAIIQHGKMHNPFGTLTQVNNGLNATLSNQSPTSSQQPFAGKCN